MHGIASGEDAESPGLMYLGTARWKAVRLPGTWAEDGHLAQRCSLRLWPCASSQQDWAVGDSGSREGGQKGNDHPVVCPLSQENLGLMKSPWS